MRPCSVHNKLMIGSLWTMLPVWQPVSASPRHSGWSHCEVQKAQGLPGWLPSRSVPRLAVVLNGILGNGAASTSGFAFIPTSQDGDLGIAHPRVLGTPWLEGVPTVGIAQRNDQAKCLP